MAKDTPSQSSPDLKGTPTLSVSLLDLASLSFFEPDYQPIGSVYYITFDDVNDSAEEDFYVWSQTGSGPDTYGWVKARDNYGLSFTETQNLSAGQKDQLAANWPEAVSISEAQSTINSILAGDIADIRGSEFAQITDLSTLINAYFHLDEASGTSTDTISALPLTETGASAIGTAAGLISQARVFTKADNSYLVSGADPAAFDHGTGSFGFSVWVKPTGVEASTSILSKGSSGVLGEYVLYFTSTLVGLYTTRSSGSGNTSVIHTGTLTLNSWNCVQCWYDGTTLNIMVNGSAVTTVAATLGIWDTAGAFRLGYGYFTGVAGTRNYFDGAIDELTHWTGDKPVSELRAIYEANLAGTPYPYVGVSALTIDDGVSSHWVGDSLTRARPDSTDFSRTLATVSAPAISSVGWDYDGTDDYHERTDASIDMTQVFSAVVLFSPDSVAATMGILGKGDAAANQLSLGVSATSKASVSYLSTTDKTLVSTGDNLVAGKTNGVLITSTGAGLSIETYTQSVPDTVAEAVDALTKPFRIGYGKVSATAAENFFDGVVRDVWIYDRVISTDDFRELVDTKMGVQAWGDSLTVVGTGGDWTGKLSTLRNDFAVTSNGYSGEGSPAIRGHYETANRDREQIHIFWAGNNSASRGVALETADMEAMVLGLRTDRFLVLGLPNRTEFADSDTNIAAAAALYDPINTAYASAYGNRFLDLQDLFINNSSTEAPTANDDADRARGIVPRTLKDVGVTDTHFSAAGGDFLSDKINERIIALGWDV
tara:strand:- start:34319 stop:36625 length:2307 start_codon:yes stop_codon:yes gene_type:complete